MSKLEYLDLSDVKFPSDKITIADLRKWRSILFDFGFGPDDEAQPRFFFNASHGRHAGDMLGGMLLLERSVAVTAYAKAEGITPPDPNYDELREALMDDYVRYQLASGRQHAEELVRDIERQARALSTAKGSPGS